MYIKYINSDFFLAPEYTLPFRKINNFVDFIKSAKIKNSVFCIPVEHLRLDELESIREILDIPPDTLYQNYPLNLNNLNRYKKLIFNVAIIAIKNKNGDLRSYIQPKIFPAPFEEQANMNPYSFQGGNVINVFRTPRLSFAILICLSTGKGVNRSFILYQPIYSLK